VRLTARPRFQSVGDLGRASVHGTVHDTATYGLGFGQSVHLVAFPLSLVRANDSGK
jgi:hypothetical protein